MRVNIGDIIKAEYRTFDGEIAEAMFVVLYHECYDRLGSDNFLGIKIATKSGCYQIPLLKAYLPFLEHDSYLNCNKIFSFRECEVKKIVGRLNTYYMNKMLQQTFNCMNRAVYQVGQMIGEENLFNFENNNILK